VLEVIGERGARYHPWRFNWPVSADTASLQKPAVGNLRWLTLEPGTMADHEEVWLKAKIDLDDWYAARRARQPRGVLLGP